MADTSTIGPWTESVTTLPPNRRYICTYSPTGTSVLHSAPAQLYHGRAGVGGMARSYAVSKVPANLSKDEDINSFLSPNTTSNPTSHKGTGIVVPMQSGANLTVDFAPSGKVKCIGRCRLILAFV